MKKEGVAHVEVILSFVLFITAIAIIFFVFNPLKLAEGNAGVLRDALRVIEKNVSVEVIQYPVGIDKRVRSEIVSIKLPDIPEGYFSTAISYSGEILKTKKSGNSILVEWKNNEFVYLKLSKIFRDTLTNIGGIETESYKLGPDEKELFLSISGLKELNNSYYKDYSLTKKELGIPTSVDFGFRYSREGRVEALAQRNLSRGVNVYSLSKKVQFVDSDGKISFGDIEVFVW